MSEIINNIEQDFTPAELEEIKILSSAVLWSEKYLRDPNNPNKPLQLRWYQKQVLESKKRKRVVRAGRRIGKTVILICEILHRLFTRQYRRIVLITPYKSQISEIWDVLERMIEYSPDIKESIKRKINNPQEIELYNGSHLKCFTAGSKTSSKGTNIRSLSADDIYLDEADYLGESALEAIEPLLMTSLDTTLWASSTPTGRRESFWKWATQSEKLGFEAFHFSAELNPSWISIEEAKKRGLPLSDSQEYYYKSSKSESFYNHEILAEFGEEEEGVFKAGFLDNNIYDFNENYEDATLSLYNPGYVQQNENKYIMGIDWNNSLNGTQIVITECLVKPTEITYFETDDEGKKIKRKEKMKERYRLFYRISLSSKESSQLSSVNKIIELLNKYRIDHIYCDLGFGQTNIELLREYGTQHKELGLDTKIVPIDFGSTVEIFDPLKKTFDKKPMKAFIVYTVVNEVEKANCLLPLVEDDKGRLIDQIRSYTIKKHSQVGAPIFSQGNDHTLIAWLLSMVGFHMEYSSFIKPIEGPVEDQIARLTKSNSLMPYLNNLDRKTIKDSKSISTLFNDVQGPKSLFGLGKVTTDPKFFSDKEKPESYLPVGGKNPWGKQIAKVQFRPNRSRHYSDNNASRSPSGRKLY